MGAATLVPIAEYLSTVYRPDCDYVDGQLEERNVGEYDHSRTQTLITAYLLRYERNLKIRVVTELRVQVSPTRFRVPDVCIVPAQDPQPQIVISPPLLCVEVLSPEDRVDRMQERIDDYLAMGVPSVWVVNPRTRRAYVYAGAGMQEAKDGILRAAGLELTVPLSELFE